MMDDAEMSNAADAIIYVSQDNGYQSDILKLTPRSCDAGRRSGSVAESVDKLRVTTTVPPSAEQIKQSWARGCGVLHLVFGFPMIALGIAAFFEETWGYQSGVAIWGGVLFLSAGFFGVWCSRSRDRRIRTACVVTAALSMIVAILAIMVAAVGIALDSVEEKELGRLKLARDATLKTHTLNNGKVFWIAYAMNSLAVVIGSLEILVGVVQTVILTT